VISEPPQNVFARFLNFNHLTKPKTIHFIIVGSMNNNTISNTENFNNIVSFYIVVIIDDQVKNTKSYLYKSSLSFLRFLLPCFCRFCCGFIEGLLTEPDGAQNKTTTEQLKARTRIQIQKEK